MLTIAPFGDTSIFEQSQEGIINPFQTYNELILLNETETREYVSDFMEEQNELNIDFFPNPILWVYLIGYTFSFSALLAVISLITNEPNKRRTKKSSLLSMMSGFVLFLIMFISFGVFKI